jgi:hypothetical protein
VNLLQSDIEFMNTCPYTIHFKIISACFKVFVECNAPKLFSPHNYPSNDSDRITSTELWLGRILLKFQYTKEESDMCKGELLEFTKTLRHECENKTIFEAWCICCNNLEGHTNWPKLMQFW